MADPDFYAADPLSQIAINLFHGWGYNFYRRENLLRADDLLIRSKASWLLGLARASVVMAESVYRRTNIPAPSREKPRPDAAAISGAQTLEALSAAIGRLESQIRSQPVPENDRMTQFYRTERTTLARLSECDHRLIGQADLLRASLEGQSGSAILGSIQAIEAGLATLDDTLHHRQAMLLNMV